MTQYPQLYTYALQQAPGSASRILAQTRIIEQVTKQLIDAAPENKVILSLPSYPQNGRFQFRVIDTVAQHKPINGGVIYGAITAWRDYEWVDKEIRWAIGSDYLVALDDIPHHQLKKTIHHVQTEQLIHAIQQQNTFTGTQPDLVLSTLPLNVRRLDQLAQALPDELPCTIVAVSDGATWCENLDSIRHIYNRINPAHVQGFIESVQSVGLYRLLNGTMHHSDRTIARHWEGDNWVCSEFLLKARYNPNAVLVQVFNRTAPDEEATNAICCQILPLLQDNACVIAASQVDGSALDAALNSFHHYIHQEMGSTEDGCLGELDE